jgi:hypothetical protein
MPTIAAGAAAVIALPSGFVLNIDGGPAGTAVAPGGLFLTLGNFQSIGPYAYDANINVSVASGGSALTYNLYRVTGTIPGMVPNVWNATDSLILAQTAQAVAHTGTTAETTLATVQIPGGVMGPNGILRVTTLLSATNNANVKTLTYRLGGTLLRTAVMTSFLTGQDQMIVRNRNSLASQVTFTTGTLAPYSGSTVALTTTALNTAQNQALTITATLATAGDTMTLEGYTVELLPD